jgi:hypothetical protein
MQGHLFEFNQFPRRGTVKNEHIVCNGEHLWVNEPQVSIPPSQAVRYKNTLGYRPAESHHSIQHGREMEKSCLGLCFFHHPVKPMEDEVA